MDTMQGIADLPIAVIGMACRLPGAGDLEQFWQLLVRGQSAVAEVPADRFDQELYYDPRQGVPAKSYTKIGALLSSREFDRTRCPLPDELVRSADPTHLLMCEVAAAACRHAGLDPFNLPADVRNAGVYVGHAQGSTLASDYIYHTCVEEAAQLLPDLHELRNLAADERAAIAEQLVSSVREEFPRRAPDSPDVSTHMVAGLVSRAFHLTGPYLALNAACASSPQALLLAVRALQLGRIDMAIVGGASDCKSDTLTLFSAAQSMSASGSRPFDSEADGLVCGEGYVALILKTLPRALADGDPIQAVIRGMGISSDGHGKSLWAPRKEGQVEAMKRAYRGGIDPASLQYIEAHATSTSLGDATELTALGEVLGECVTEGQKVALGSVKANIGHTLECAGLASVCKTILCMQKRTIPGAINVRELNKKIDWQKAPYFVPTKAIEWREPPAGQPRRAAVNSFGIGGLNMHIVLEEYSPSVHRRDVWIAPPQQHFRSVEEQAVAVVGMGCILPGAEGIEEYWHLLESGRQAIVEAPVDRWISSSVTRRLPTDRGGFVTAFQYDWRRHKVPPKQVAQADPMQFMLLETADQALKHAGYEKRPFSRKSTGVLVGTEFGGDFSTQLTLGLRLPHMQKLLGELLRCRGIDNGTIEQAKESFARALLARFPALIDETGSFSTSTLASRITKTFDLMGGAAAIDSGDTSAMSALAGSIDLLLAGDCDAMLCAAGQRRMAAATYEALAMAGVLAEEGHAAAPFDTRARGFVPGEGVGVVMVKRLNDARRDGDRIYAIIRGIGAARCDCTHQAIELAMERSFACSATKQEEIGLVELDSHGLADEDGQLVSALQRVYGGGRAQPLVVGTSVGQLGHTGGASGMVSLLKATLEVEQGTVPKIVGLENPLPAVSGDQILAPLENTRLRYLTADRRRLAGVVSQGKGLAFHIVLERAGSVPSDSLSSAPRESRILAASVPPTTSTTASMIVRSSQVVDTFVKLAAPKRDHRPRIAFLFPGQGSQYSGMLRELVGASPAARAAMERIDEVMRRSGEPTFAEIAWNGGGQLGRDIWLTQVAMLFADLIVDAALRERGIRPDVVAGHSFGEIAALTAAGSWDIEGAVSIVKARAAGVSSAGTQGALLATSAPRERLEELIATLGQPVYVANHNAPDQSIVGGTREALHALTTVLKEHGYSSQSLAVPAAFHTPLMLGASGPLEAALHSTAVLPPRIPLLSSISTRYEADPQTIRENLTKQLTRPVEWVSLIRRLVGEGPIVLVEVGPQQVLTKLSRRILQERQVVGIIATDDPKRPGPAQLDAVCQLLSSAGVLDGHDEPVTRSAVAASQPWGKVVHFDATESRREKMRRAAAKLEQEPAESRSAAPTEPLPAELPVTSGHRFDAPLASVSAVKDNGHAPQHERSVKSNGAAPKVEPAQLESFLINFVVEQTGYPPDVVDLDADLEADLGIDSIKKAQMFGELQEYFPDVVQPRDDLTLDDFPTLRHVLAFLRGEIPHDAADQSPVTSEASPFAASEPAQPAIIGPNTPAEQLTAPAVATEAVSGSSRAEIAELESFLVNFVVEQTGYPRDVVDLDADLEADLGIDSIKKAQMFGELQEYFPNVVQPRDDLTLDDFPTLRHVLNFLRGEVLTPTAPPGVVLPSIKTSPVSAEPSVIGNSGPPSAVTPSASAPRVDPEQLESFLVNFVVEQTGYPPDVVDVDADLEADLGIDSIKKAQMFGELQEYFPDVVQPRDDLTLDDFPTLRHILDFLRREMPEAQSALQPASAEPHQSNGELKPGGVPEAKEEALTLHLSGTPYEMGLAHGRHLQDRIRRVLRYYADLADETLEELPLSELRDRPEELFTADELEEMRGIADGAGVPFGNIVSHNVALLADLGVSTTQLVVPGGQHSATIHALEEPLPLVAGLREELQPVVQIRQAPRGVPHSICSFAGLVFGLSGINAAGLAVTSGAAAAHHSQGSGQGRLPALLVAELLQAARDIDTAVAVARQFNCRTPWNAFITNSATGEACYLEHDGHMLHVRQLSEATVVRSTGNNGHSYGEGTFTKLSRVLDSSSELSSAAGVRRVLSRYGNRRSGSTESGAWHASGVVVEEIHRDDPVLHIIMQPSARQLWLGGVGPANGSLVSVRLDAFAEQRSKAGAVADGHALKKKDLSHLRPR